MAWAIGPAIGAILIGSAGYHGAFFGSAASGAVALGTLAFVKRRIGFADIGNAYPARPAKGGPGIALAFAALALFYTAMFLGQIPLPIVLTTSLGGAESDVGITMSLCAALEIVVMGALIWKPLQRGERVAIVAGFAAFIVYFFALTLVRSVEGVFWAQIARAIGIALVTYLGISFLHSPMPHPAGAAAALFSNSGQVGSVLAAFSVGGLAKAFGYGSIFVVCAVLSVAGLACVCLRPAEPD